MASSTVVNNYQVVSRTAFPWNVLLLQPNWFLYNIRTCPSNFDTYNINTQNIFHKINIVCADGLMWSKSECLTTIAVQSAHTLLTFLKDKCVSFACAYIHSLYQLLMGRWNFISAIKLYHYCVGVWHIPTYVNNICSVCAWWRHQMETFSALLVLCVRNSPVRCEFHSQRPVTRSFDVFFDLRLNKR